MSTRARFALAALSGVITFAAFPGVGAWPLAFVAWVPLLLALEGQTPRRAAALGFVAGLFATGPALRFLVVTLQEQSGLPTIACAAIYLLVAAYHALRGVVVGLVSRAVPAHPGPPSLLFIAGLALSEIAIPSLFPWYFGASVHAVPLFVQPAEIGGPVLVSVVLAASSVGVAETISSWGPNRQTKPRVVIPAFAIPIVFALWGSLRVSQIDAQASRAPSFVAGVVQTNLARSDETEAERRLREGTKALVSKGATLAVWPEGALPWTLPYPLVESAFAMIGAPKIAVITGALVQGEGAPPPPGERIAIRADDASRRVTNSALLFDADRWIGRYDKRRLLPFSETLPFEKELPWLRDLSPMSGQFAAGTTLAPLRLGGRGIATFICYEDLFPAHVSDLTASGDVELLVNVTNDSWFGKSEPEMHLALAKMRAVEQRKYMLRSTVTGVSAIVDPVGRAIASIPQDREDAIAAEIHWMKGRTLYATTGDAPWWVFALGTIVISVMRHRRSKRDGTSAA